MQQNVIAYVPKTMTLEDFLKKHPMSLVCLARLLGVDENTTRSWSCHRRKPQFQTFIHLAVIDERFIENPELREQFVKV